MRLTYTANLNSLASIEASNRYSFLRKSTSPTTKMSKIVRRTSSRRRHAPGRGIHVDRSITERGVRLLRPTSSKHLRVAGRGARILAKRPAEREGKLPFPARCRPTRSMAAWGPKGFFEEGTAYSPRSPLFGLEGVGRPPGQRLAPHLRPADRDLELLRTTTKISFPGKADPPGDDQRPWKGRTSPVYGAGANVRDWLYVDDHARALYLILTQGRLGEVQCGRPQRADQPGGRQDDLRPARRDGRPGRTARRTARTRNSPSSRRWKWRAWYGRPSRRRSLVCQSAFSFSVASDVTGLTFHLWREIACSR